MFDVVVAFVLLIGIIPGTLATFGALLELIQPEQIRLGTT